MLFAEYFWVIVQDFGFDTDSILFFVSLPIAVPRSKCTSRIPGEGDSGL